MTYSAATEDGPDTSNPTSETRDRAVPPDLPDSPRTPFSPDIVAILTLDELGPDRFLGIRVPVGLPRVFGGQVLAQALVAAGRTVPESKSAHSLHAYFLRGGDHAERIEYRVERVRDGRRLSCRTVTAEQHGKVIAVMTTSFADTTGGVDHQIPALPYPAPQDVPVFADAALAWGGLGPAWSGFEAIEIRVDPLRSGTGFDEVSAARGRIIEPAELTDRIWQRAAVHLPTDQLLHQATLVYASDVMILAAALVPYGVPLGQEEINGRYLWDGVSVDHAVWFHRPVVADEWMLFQQLSPSAAEGRAFTRAEVFDPSGVLLASVAQEGLIIGLD